MLIQIGNANAQQVEIPLTNSEMGRQEIVGRDGSNSAFWAAYVSMSMKCITFTAYGPKSVKDTVRRVQN